MKKLAIIGASYLQEPLIQKAKSLGIETHVFAWAADDVGEKSADYFYPISIVEKEQILEKCKEISIDGICSIASDLACVTVNYVAEKMGLIGNLSDSVLKTTNKHEMRKAFKQNNDPSPVSILVESEKEIEGIELKYPVIVKPLDRSGSRGITKLSDSNGLEAAIELAKEQGFIHKALVEEFIEGKEYSVECISWEGEHFFLAITQKYTTGSPHFIETGHMEPALLSDELTEKVKNIIFHALDSLEIRYGASHSEIKIDKNGDIVIVEIGARMGGDYIGSHLVQLSTGIDFVRAVIDIALGQRPDLSVGRHYNAAIARFVLSKEDIYVLNEIKEKHPDYLVVATDIENINEEITDSSNRHGAYVIKSNDIEQLLKYEPMDGKE